MSTTILAESFDWAKKFESFTLFHLIVAGSFSIAMFGAWAIGRRLRNRDSERRFRIGWGYTVLVYKILETAWYNWPGNFDIKESLPLQLCDLAAFVAAAAMITHKRPLRTMLYFWGIGLSTQGFFTPILKEGYESWRFWFFWISHTMIIGSATYDVVVCRYRPTLRDVVVAFAWTLAFAGVAMAVNLMWDVNYGYIGNTKPENRTIIDDLGSWPLRVVKLAVLIVFLFLLLWAVWPISRRLRGSRSPTPEAPQPPAA